MVAFSQSSSASVSVSQQGSASSTSATADSQSVQGGASSTGAPSFAETLLGIQSENASAGVSADLEQPSAAPIQIGTRSGVLPLVLATSPGGQSSAAALPGQRAGFSTDIGARTPASRQTDPSFARQVALSEISSSAQESPSPPGTPPISTVSPDPRTGEETSDAKVRTVSVSEQISSSLTQPLTSNTVVSAQAPAVAESDQLTAPSARAQHASQADAESNLAVEDESRTATNRGELSRHLKKASGSAVKATVGNQSPTDSAAPNLLAMESPPVLSIATVSGAAQSSQSGESGPSVPITQNTSSIAAGGLSSTPLAFAVRLRNDTSAAAYSGGAATGGNQSGDASGNQAGSNLAQQTQALGGTATGLPTTAAGLTPTEGQTLAQIRENAPGDQKTSTDSSNDQDAVSSGSAADTTQTVDANTGAVSTKPMRSMQVQITGQDNQRIDLKLVERSGSLSMSVRTPDGNLTRAMQEHLPELANKLADQPAQADWWNPKNESSNIGNAPGSGNNKQNNSGFQGQDSSSGQNSGRQQGGGQNNQPDWVDELAETGNQKTFRKEYIWHQ